MVFLTLLTAVILPHFYHVIPIRQPGREGPGLPNNWPWLTRFVDLEAILLPGSKGPGALAALKPNLPNPWVDESLCSRCDWSRGSNLPVYLHRPVGARGPRPTHSSRLEQRLQSTPMPPIDQPGLEGPGLPDRILKIINNQISITNQAPNIKFQSSKNNQKWSLMLDYWLLPWIYGTPSCQISANIVV